MRSKYNARPVEIDGHKFPSTREGERYRQLKFLQEQGLIRGLTLQPKFPIVINGEPVRYPPTPRNKAGRAMVYTADFSFYEGSTRRVIDVKGVDTKDGRVRRILAEHIYRIKIEVEK